MFWGFYFGIGQLDIWGWDPRRGRRAPLRGVRRRLTPLTLSLSPKSAHLSTFALLWIIIRLYHKRRDKDEKYSGFSGQSPCGR